MYGFEDFRIEPDERRLWRGEAAVTLTPKAFDLLLFLVEHEGRLLRKNDLLSAVWPDSAVEENNLTVAVSALRKALGESEKRRFIETVPKKGYRFVAQVTDLRYQEALRCLRMVWRPLLRLRTGRRVRRRNRRSLQGSWLNRKKMPQKPFQDATELLPLLQCSPR